MAARTITEHQLEQCQHANTTGRQLIPWAVANASYKQQQDNRGVTEIVEIKGRGHPLILLLTG